LCLEVLLHDYMNHNPQAETLYAIVEQLRVKSYTIELSLSKYLSITPVESIYH
jgi:hypothetical protein